MWNSLVSVLLTQWTFLVLILLYIVYKWSVRPYDYFAKKGVAYNPPKPFFGNLMDMILKRKSFTDVAMELYNMFPSKKFIGLFDTRNVIFMIRDPELIKQIAVKDFEFFLDHRSPIDETVDALFGRSLFFLKGQKWRDMRATLSPAFTGSKMRQMFQLVIDCSNESAKFLLKESKKQSPLIIDSKDFFTRFTNDVIATAAFGIKVDSLAEPNNEFYMMGKDAINFDGIRGLKFFAVSLMPTLMKFLRLQLFPESMRKLFRTLVIGTMAVREKEGIVRPDMINLLMQARKGKLIHENEKQDQEGFATVEESSIGFSSHQRKWEDDDLTAQCVLFFFAGFDTSSTLMCFAAYELAVNPEIQKTLIEEIDSVTEQLNGGKLTYEILQKMQYMDMVISETLRKWPPAIVTDRFCVKPYVLKTEEGDVDIEPGIGIWIPIVGIHHDPKYYPDPERFDPERFSEENKKNISPFIYMPFGVGPRNCIGSRFALMECKAVLFSILSNFSIEVSPKTQVPLKLAKARFSIKAEKGFWVQLKPRATS